MNKNLKFFIKEEKVDQWLVTYGDLMSFMMMLFIMFYAIAIHSINSNDNEILSAIREGFKGKKGLVTVAEKRKQALVESLEEKIKLSSSINKEDIKIETTHNAIKLNFSQPVLYESGKADLKKAFLPVLREIGSVLKESDNPIIIEGHTDNIPIRNRKYKSNWHLSYDRAYSLLEFLVRYNNISPKRLTPVGYGAFRPLASNNDYKGRAKNRRIEIKIILEDSQSLIKKSH